VKIYLGIALALLTALSSGILNAEETPAVWAKGFTSEGAGKKGLLLIGVGQTKTDLNGLFVYYHISPEDGRTEPVVITGTTSQTGLFWADATLQVKKTADSEWELVGKSTGKGDPKTMTVALNEGSNVFRIDFDDLKRFITTHKLARVIISSGALDEFELEALTPLTR
jgi:hypothetical protein